MKKTQSAGGVVLNALGEVALVKNGTDFWGFPKGHIDPGEDEITAARREITEETGLTQLELVRKIGSYVRYRGLPGGGEDPSELKDIHMFLFTTTEEKLEPQDPMNPEARWAEAKNVAEMLTNQKDRDFFLSVDITR